MITTNDALRRLALTKVLRDKEVQAARAAVLDDVAGDTIMDVDFTVRITGTLHVSEPYTQRQVGSVPWDLIAMACFDRLNEATRRAVLDEVLAAWNNGEVAALRDDLCESCKDSTWHVFEGLRDRTAITTRKVTPRLSMEVIQ